MGCDVLDRIEKRGFEKGKKEGEDNLVLLSQKLFSQDRIEDLKRAMEDKDYCDQLKKEFGIL